MKRLITVLMAAAIGLSSCTKTTNSTGSNDTGTIRYTNQSSNPYTIYLDGTSKGSLDGGKYTEFTVYKGDHSTKAEQISGYVVYPTVRTGTVTIAGGDSKEFIFP